MSIFDPPDMAQATNDLATIVAFIASRDLTFELEQELPGVWTARLRRMGSGAVLIGSRRPSPAGAVRDMAEWVRTSYDASFLA